MNANLLTIDNTFAGNVGASPALLLTPPPTKNTKQFAPTPADNPPPANVPKKTTTDNKLTSAQNEHISRQMQNFGHTLRKTTITKMLQEGQGSTKLKKQRFASVLTVQPNSTQFGAAQDFPTVTPGKAAVTTKILVKPKAGHKSAQLFATPMFATPKACKSSLVTGQTAKQTNRKLGQMVPVTSQSKNKPITIDQSQSGLKAVLPDISKDPLTPDIQPLLIAGKGKNADKIQMPNKIVVAIKDLTNQESGKESMPQAPTVNSKTTTASKKPAVVDKPAIPDSKKMLVLEALTADGKTTAAKRKPAVADKPAVSNGKKMLVLNDGLPTVQDKSPYPQQKVPVGPEKSVTVAEKPTDNKAAAGQQGHPGKSELSELSDGNGKTQTHNPSSDSILQKLNPTHVQISTNQTKDPRNSTSNNSSDSDSEQILSTNNVQTLITEQSSASSQIGKAANNTLPGDISTSISEQIQESIHSLLRQGDQQITIRLNPPELGKVFIKFQEQEDQITGLLEVSKIQTRYEIEQALPQIIRNLQDSGIQIKRLEVVLIDQSEQQAYKDQSLQNSWSQQHGSAEGNNPDNTPANEWLANTNSHQDIPEPQQGLITDNSINILI